MGLAKSLRKAGSFETVKANLQNLAGILEANRKKEEQKQFFSTVVDLYDKWKQGQEMASMKTGLKEGEEVTNVLSPENLTGITGKKPTGLNLEVKIPENIQSNLPVDTAPETRTREISPKERYEKGQENLSDFVEAIAPLVMNPNIDESSLSRANVLTNLAQQQTERLKPKDPTYFNLGAGQKRFKTDESGKTEEVAFNPKDPEKKNIYERVETFNVKGKPVKMGLRKDNGEWEELGEAYYRPRVTNINIQQEEEGRLKESTAKLIADLKNFKPYSVDEAGNKVPMSSEDIKFAKDSALENIKLQLLKPRAYEFITNIETLWREGDATGSRQYLSPKELYNEVLKHAESGNLDEKTQDEIATYLRYYSQDIYKGLTTQPEGK